MTDRVPVRPDLADIEPYGAPQLDVPVRLNTNETAHPPPATFTEVVAERLQDLRLHRYPDRDARELRERLAALVDADPDGVWAANGSNEILQQLLQAYGGPDRRLLLFRPGYSMYPLLAAVTGTPYVQHDLDDELRLTPAAAAAAVDEHDPDLVLLAHPNNPTGIPVPHGAIRVLHDRSRALIVVDEAYVEFGGGSALGLLQALPRLAVSRTFSKAYRLAGLRVGYLVARPWVVDDILRVRLPYHLDTVKQQAALVALDLGPSMLDHIPEVRSERQRVAERLRRLPDVHVYPSEANFILFRTTDPSLFDRLLDRGVLIRDFSDVPRLEGCLRVTVGGPDENDAFLDAMESLLGR